MIIINNIKKRKTIKFKTFEDFIITKEKITREINIFFIRTFSFKEGFVNDLEDLPDSEALKLYSWRVLYVFSVDVMCTKIIFFKHFLRSLSMFSTSVLRL